MPDNKIQSLQVLRAFAACSVVLVHAVGRVHITWPETPSYLTVENTHWGAGGVDLFFVLSGFLMTYLHAQQFGQPGVSGKFFSRRLIRIVPIYWLLSGVALIAALTLPQLMLSERPIEWPWLLGNFGFVPIPQSNGSIDRLLVVGWTLDYEMLFYTCFAVAMFWRRGLWMLCGAMLASVTIGLASRPDYPVLQWLTSPMLLEFLAGIAIAIAIQRYQAPRWIAWLLLVGGVAAFLASWTADRVWQWGIPAAAVVVGTLWLQFNCKGHIGRSLVVVGDASYSVYLTQVFSLPALAILMKLADIGLSGDLAIVVLWLAACTAGVLFWWLVEKPLTDRLREFPTRRLKV